MATTDSGHSPGRRGIASRAAHWSAEHRKTAIFGFIAFAIVAFMAGQSIGTNQLTDLDQFTGETQRAEQARDDAGLRPVEEVVLVQSDELTIDDPEFRAAIEDVTERMSGVPYVENVISPLTGDAEVTADGHAALVTFEIAGDSVEAKDRVDPTLAETAAIQAEHPELVVEQFGGASASKAINETIAEDIGKAGLLSLPITLIILMLTFGSLVAAGVPLLIGITSVVAALGAGRDSEPAAAARRERLGGDPDDRPRGRGRLLALLPAARAGGAGRRAHDPRTALEIAAATSGRAVLISGLTVLVAMAGMFISGDNAFISFAYGTMIVVAIAMFASLTVLPAILDWLGDRVEKGRLPFIGRRRRPAGQSRFWSALTDRVMRRPVRRDRARGRIPGGARDPGAAHEDSDHQRRGPASGSRRDQDL